MSNYLAATPGPPPLDWPQYNIGFRGAVKRAFRKYATFSGRASLSEYWWYQLFFLMGFFGAGIMVAIFGAVTSPDGGTTAGPGGYPFIVLGVLFLVANILPSISITVRRLHDAGFSGWFYLLNLVLPIVVFVLTLLGTSWVRAAQYGPPAAPNPYLTIPGQPPGAPVYGQAPPPPPYPSDSGH